MWDFKLFKAHYIIQDWYRDGIPVWWDESDRVAFDAVPRISKSRAAVDKAQESASKNKKSVPGRYFVAEPRVVDGGDFPTKDEWLKEQEVKSFKSPQYKSQVKEKNIVQGRK